MGTMTMMRITRTRRVYLGPLRIHHGAFGTAMFLLGALLVWHDRRDFPWWLIDHWGPK